MRVVHGRNWPARLLARLLRLPRAGDAVETQLIVTAIDGGERWQRTFADQTMNSTQYPVAGGGVAERFGPIEFRFAQEHLGDATCFRQVGVAVVAGPIRVPLPRLCAPTVTAREHAQGPRTRHVDVRVDLPGVGPLLAYTGTIEVEEGRGTVTTRTSGASEPAERPAFAPKALRRGLAVAFGGGGSGPRSGVPASDAVGESEGRSPSDD